MVAAGAVASSEAWKPAREFRRLARSWEGCEAQQAWTTHREQLPRFKVSQGQGNLRSCNLARSPLHRGARGALGDWGVGCTKSPRGILPSGPEGWAHCGLLFGFLTPHGGPQEDCQVALLKGKAGSRSDLYNLGHPLHLAQIRTPGPFSRRCVAPCLCGSGREWGLCRGPARPSVSCPDVSSDICRSFRTALPAVAPFCSLIHLAADH